MCQVLCCLSHNVMELLLLLLLHVSTVERRGWTEGELRHSPSAFWAMCGRVDTSGNLCICKSEKKREERAWLTVQSVMKCTASKPNRFWKQRPFPKSHSHTHHLFPLSCSYLFCLSLLQCWDCLSLYFCLCSEFTILSSRTFCKCQIRKLWPTRRTKERTVTE